MAQDEFQKVCDQFSSTVDDVQFERFRWDRDEAPKLARLVELVQSAFEDRRDFDLAEEGGTSGLKKYVVKVHSMRTVAISVGLQNGKAILTAETVARSPYTLEEGGPVGTAYENVNEEWIAAALQLLISRVRAPNQPPQAEVEPNVDADGDADVQEHAEAA